MKDGFINILKPPGMTSHDAVGCVRRMLGIKKAGHAGTLDPGAAGVLPVAVGRATRFIEYLEADSKSYRAELTFGFATDSGDDLGERIAEMPDYNQPDEAEIHRVLAGFTGKITQTPPVYSAIKINGQKACDLARHNLPVEIPSREITIYRLELLERRENGLLFDTDCSKGTYIRSLCTDIGRALGIPAVMSFLVRTRVGGFLLADSVSLEELAGGGESVILPPEKCLQLEHYELPLPRAKAFCNGLPTGLREWSGSDRKMIFGGGAFIGVGVYDRREQALRPEKVFPPEW